MSESTTSKRHVILTSWASVATALVIMLLIGGAFYTADLKSRECSQSGSTTAGHNTKDYSQTYDEGDSETKEDIHLDEDDYTELIIKKSKDGTIEMLIATDFNKKITATYVPAIDECFLLAGTDVDFLTQWQANEDETIEVGDDVKQKDYKVSGNLVTDKTLLPSVMQPYCNNKPTYWMQPTDESDMEQVRQKRDQCWCKWCYYWISGGYLWRYCWWSPCSLSYCI